MDNEDPVRSAYLDAWGAVTQLLRRGYSWSGNERHIVQIHTGNRFVDASGVTGLDLAEDGRAAARVDWDGDGDLDLVLTARTSPRLRVLRNDQTSDNGWVDVGLVDADGGTAGTIGARLELRLDGGDRERLVATRRIGSGFLAQSTGRLQLGLGPEATVREARVRWPDGTWESFGPLASRTHVRLRRGTGSPEPDPTWNLGPRVIEPLAAQPTAARSLPTEAPRRLVTRVPLPMPTVSALGPQGTRLSILGTSTDGERGQGHPVLVQLVSHTCAPCAAELVAFGQRTAELADAELEVVALTVDPADEWDDWRAFLERTGFLGTRGVAAPETVEMLDTLQSELLQRDRRIGIPTSFLVDADGDLQVVYFGRVEVDQVLTDLALADLPSRDRRFAALPFPGRFLDAALPANLSAWQRAFETRGQPAAAADFLRARQRREIVGQAEVHLEHGRARLQQGELELAGRHFEAALDVDPTLADAWKGLAFCRHRLEAFGPAIDAYLQALVHDPDDARTRLNLGLAYVSIDDLDAADRELATLIAARSPDARRLERAITTQRLQDPTGSVPPEGGAEGDAEGDPPADSGDADEGGAEPRRQGDG